ncbi:SH3 domain-containing protein [Flammeovirga sp. MY04]|uniref:DUF5675 family protein n=1 Tax=Flammeovirga sp. MY04 TaxID=1191459 RepID=UPI0008062CA3|nr:DUF5675 family protein [Flammeovirga sp. MY04]ANQ47404.1 SH3 domain-containing protein [Flammeovirga sp. MY04]
MKAIITRTNYHPLQTTGHFQLLDNDGVEIFCCDTLELPWKENKNRISCIPLGHYKATFRTIGAYANRSFHIQELDGGEVKGRSHILIHSGNFFTDTKGCVLLGRGYADISLKKRNIQQDNVLDLLNSGNTISELIGLTCDFTLEIVSSQKEKISDETAELSIKDKDFVRVNVKSTLNLRSEPSTQSSIIKRLQNDTLLEVIGIKGEWAEVKSVGVEGWVSIRYIDQFDDKGQVNVENGYLNIRAEGDINASKVIEDGLLMGEEVRVISKNKDWLKVVAREFSGFVHNEYLKKEI